MMSCVDIFAPGVSLTPSVTMAEIEFQRRGTPLWLVLLVVVVAFAAAWFFFMERNPAS